MTETPDLSQQQVGRYRIVAFLGAGGMGTVYDAIDSTLGRHVALKVISPRAAADNTRLQRFIQEAKAASALNHPHLVPIYEIGSSVVDGVPVHFMAMEKVDGKTLRDLMARETLPLRRSLELMSQICEAVAAAHSVGVIHRDLKPENIMVSSAGYAKVLDFGLAKLADRNMSDGEEDAATAVRSTQSGVILGTAGYMSPEQAQGKEADHRTDIFALGCILYELVSGKRAFRGTSSVDTLHQIIHNEPRPLGEAAPVAPAELQRIVRKAMAKDPEDRYQSAKDLAVDLRAQLRDLSTPPAPVAVRRPWRMVAAIMALAVLLGLGLLVWRRSPVVRPAPAIEYQRVTFRGNVIDAQISPDGRFVAFAVREADGQTLWLKQLASGQELQLIPKIKAALWGITFTRDGNNIVYGMKTHDEPRGVFYRLSTLGGHPERLVGGLDSAVSFSPDGKRMTWVRAEFPQIGQSALMVANSDGSDAHPLAVRRVPERFAPMFFTKPSWSPDGKLIAASIKRTENPAGAKLIGVDPQSGKETILSDRGWSTLNALDWLPDGSAIIAVGAREGGTTDPITLAGTKLWMIPYPSGEPRRITNDANYYRDPSISADGTKLMAVASDAKVHLSRLSLVKPGPPESISSGRYDGVAGVAELADGRIIFTSVESIVSLWIMAPDGSGRRQLTRDAFENRFPVPFSGGIAYVSTTPAESDVCLINEEGEGRRVIVRGVDAAPIAASPDGKSVVYSLNRCLWRVSTDGGQRRQLTTSIAANPSYSPDGDRIAFLTGDAQQPEGSHIVVMNAAGDKVLSTHDVQRQGGTLRWTRDGKAILLHNFDTQNISVYPLHGGPPKQLSHVEDMVWSFDIAHDGKSIVVGQGSLARDAVLITGFR